MWAALFSWLGSFIAGPLVESYKAKLQQGTDHDKLAADLAGRELDVQRSEAELQTQYRIAEIGHWYEPDKLMGYCVAAYLAKLLVWDKVLGLGVTDPLAGWVLTTTNLIVGFYFSKRTVENVAKIWRR